MITTKRKPPTTLGTCGKKLWSSIIAEFEIAESHSLALLEKVCIQADRCESARKEIAKTGISILDRYGCLKENPIIATERQAINLMRLCLRELCLDSEVATGDDFRIARTRDYK